MRAWLILLLFFASSAAWAQNFNLEGFVFDEQDKPIAGAFVQVEHEGHYLSTSSDDEGYFALKNVGAEDSLRVLHASFERVMLPINNQKRMVIKLAVRPVALQIVSVVSYPSPALTLQEMFKDDYMFKGDSIVGKIFALSAGNSGGEMELIRFLAETINYPIEARENKAEGTVEVSFLVNKRGFVRQPVITKSLGFGCDEEVLKAVLSLPPFRPAFANDKTAETPFKWAINFSLKQEPLTAINVQFPDTLSDGPIFIWNDTVYENYQKLGGIHPSIILNTELFKGKAATDQFGEPGRNGVILITTKKQ